VLTRLCSAACIFALMTSLNAQTSIESQAPSGQKIHLSKILGIPRSSTIGHRETSLGSPKRLRS
jgi:hypothetical protein